MSHSNITTAGILAAMLFSGAGHAFAGCVVADPTGTPLNVRSEPRGRVLSTLGNGLIVQIVDELALGGKRWAKVASNGETLGWVFADYLDCAMVDDGLKSAPMRPRDAPQ